MSVIIALGLGIFFQIGGLYYKQHIEAIKFSIQMKYTPLNN